MQGNIFSPEYIVSNLIAIALIVIAVWRPYVTRVALAVVFILAGIFNMYIAIRHPQTYMGFADVAALALYENFIRGYFAHHITSIIVIIAVLQLLVGIFIASGYRLSRLALAGAALFLVAIAPLGAGAAFPSTIFAAIACIVLLFKKDTGPETFIIEGGQARQQFLKTKLSKK